MNLQKGIHETTEYLETFLRDWLLNEKNELYNRNLHISGLLIEEKVDIGDTKVDIKNEKVDIQDKKWILKAAGLRIQDQSQAGGFYMPGVRPGPHVI